jgi:hypothetical protein
MRFDVRNTSTWREYDLPEGEVIEGTVLRLPERGGFAGKRLFIQDNVVLAIKATRKCGHTDLERQLKKFRVVPGDVVQISYFCGETPAGYRTRDYKVVKVSAAHRVVEGWLEAGALA